MSAPVMNRWGQKIPRERTFQPVRRNSYYRGDREGRVWRSFASSAAAKDRRRAAIMAAARQLDRETREERKAIEPRARNGDLGHIGLDVLEWMLRLIDWRTGCLEPAIDTIAAKIARSRKAVCAALKRLSETGFLKWIRRSEPTGNDGAGPQVEQITNAYWPEVPERAQPTYQRLMGRSDALERKRRRDAEAAAERDRLEQAMSPRAYVEATVDNPELREVLARWADAIEPSANHQNAQNEGQDKIL